MAVAHCADLGPAVAPLTGEPDAGEPHVRFGVFEGMAQTNELRRTAPRERYPVEAAHTSPPGDIANVGGPSVVRSDRRMEAAPSALVSALEQ